jgi:hypothetical protein
LRWLGQFIVKQRIVGHVEQHERICHWDHRYDHHCVDDWQHDDYDWQHVNDHRHDDDHGCQ